MQALCSLLHFIVFLTVENIKPCIGISQTDYCSDDASITYKYTPVIDKNQDWYNARKTCLTEKNGCLAQPKNKSELMRIKSFVSNHAVHGTLFYWVGLKMDLSQKLIWDNGNPVSVNAGIKEIINFSIPKKREFCFALTKASKLQPVENCATFEKFVCQIPTNKTPTQHPATTTKTKKRDKTRKTTPTTYTKKMPKTTQIIGRVKTLIDTMVDKYLKNASKMKVDDKNSINTMLKLTSALMRNLKSNHKKQKGGIMRVALMMETFGMRYAKRHLRSSQITRMLNKSDGMVFEMRKLSSKKRIVFPCKNDQDEGQGGGTTIELPDSIFKGQDLMMVNALFTEVTDYIPLTRDNDSVISPVISSTLDPKPPDVLKDNVTIVLEHFKKTFEAEPTCVFWDTNVKNDLGGEWSSVGCRVVESNETRTVCSCNHLTSFALLMQVDKTVKETSNTDQVMLSYITYIGCTLSLIGEALTVLAYTLFMNMKQEQCQIRVNLAISLAVAQIFFLSGITATSNLEVCTFVAVMLHYFYLVAFGWMMLEGVYLYLMVVKVFNTVIKMRLYYIFAWGFPLPFVTIPLIVASTLEDGITGYTNMNFCWLSFSNGLIWSFVGPVILISLANLFILVCALREIVRLNRDKLDQVETFRQGVKACVVLFPLLGLTWLFGLLSVTDAGIVFQYLFTILNSFQGFLIFVLHCLRSGEIRSSIKHKLERWEISRLNTFTSSRSTLENSSTANDNNQQKYKPDISVTDSSVQETLAKHNRVEPINA